MDFLNLNESVKTSIRIAQGLARDLGNGCYTSAHLLKALLHKEIGLTGFLQSMDKDVAYMEEWADVRIDDLPKSGLHGEMVAAPEIAGVFEEADNVRIKLGLLEVNPICVLTALVKPGIGFDVGHLKSFPVRENEILDLYLSGGATKGAPGFPGMDADDGAAGMPASSLMKYCIDKTALARESSNSSIVGREGEHRMMVEILGRHSRPNVLITGDPGVGKTALVDGLAWDIVNKKVPSFLEDVVLYELDNGALVAGATYKGEIEDRLKGIIKDLRKLHRAILFIDDIHTLLDPKSGNSGAGSILKPELSRGDLTVIGATSVDEYRKIIEPDQAFGRRFEVLMLQEPAEKVAVEMLQTVSARYADYHRLKVAPEALKECVRLSKRYIKDRKLPDAAIDLLDRSMSAVKMMNETSKGDLQEFQAALAEVEGAFERSEEERVADLRQLYLAMQSRLSPVLLGMLTQETDAETLNSVEDWLPFLGAVIEELQAFCKEAHTELQAQEIAAVVANKTGIPIGKIQSGERERLLKMEDLLRKRVVGQDAALKSLVDAILESRSGMNKPGQPIGSFFLLGPTGTGKTELAKALAEALFNDEKAMIRFDMSEFKEEHSAALLYGAPPGYVGYEEGGMLVNKIRQQPYAVVLFDEIEKAHASVYDIFLQVMDEGKLHDRLGKEGDFSNAIVLFTSNVGSQWLLEQREAGKQPSVTEMMDVMGTHFRPEFLARLSEIVPFYPITEEVLLKIFDIQMKDVHALLEKQGITLVVTEDARKMLAFKGFTPRYGARQVSGIIRNYIRRPLSRFLISGQLSKGSTMVADLDEDGTLRWKQQEPELAVVSGLSL